jgi:Cysteine-rich secretory protein family
VLAKPALVCLAVAAAVALVVWRIGASGSEPAPISSKRSSCGAVGLPANDLGLGPSRTLTVCLLNAERARRGLDPLQPEARLDAAAQRPSEDMVRRGYFEHDTPEGVDPQPSVPDLTVGAPPS